MNKIDWINKKCMSFLSGGNQSMDKLLLTHGIISKMGLHNTSIPFPVSAAIDMCILGKESKKK